MKTDDRNVSCHQLMPFTPAQKFEWYHMRPTRKLVV